MLLVFRVFSSCNITDGGGWVAGKTRGVDGGGYGTEGGLKATMHSDSNSSAVPSIRDMN